LAGTKPAARGNKPLGAGGAKIGCFPMAIELGCGGSSRVLTMLNRSRIGRRKSEDPKKGWRKNGKGWNGGKEYKDKSLALLKDVVKRWCAVPVRGTKSVTALPTAEDAVWTGQAGVKDSQHRRDDRKTVGLRGPTVG